MKVVGALFASVLPVSVTAQCPSWQASRIVRVQGTPDDHAASGRFE
jgi:hypothetical protein